MPHACYHTFGSLHAIGIEVLSVCAVPKAILPLQTTTSIVHPPSFDQLTQHPIRPLLSMADTLVRRPPKKFVSLKSASNFRPL